MPNGALKCSDKNVFDDIAGYIYATGTELDSDNVEETLNQGGCVCLMNRGQGEIQLIYRFAKMVDLYEVLFFWRMGNVDNRQVLLQNSEKLERRFVRCLNDNSDILAAVNGKTPEWYKFPKDEFVNIRSWYKSF